MLAARYRLDPIATEWEAAVADLTDRKAVERLWALDHTLFQDDPADAANRMGWLRVPDFSRQRWADIAAAAAAIADENDHVVLMGMGGSSLFPEVLTQTFGPADGYPTMHVLDTTDPAAIAAVLAQCPPERTFCVAASKSGSTLETRSHLELFWARSGDPSHFAVITDPGSALGDLARDRGFRHVWENDPDIGGRYSALSLFGIVPAALLGLDGTELLDAADEMAEALQPSDDDSDLNLGIALGAAIGAAAKGGRDKLTILIDGRVATFGLWLEQLVAESLGKHGVGAVPVVGEPADIALAHPDDRLIVVVGDAPGAADVAASGVPSITLTLEETTDIGAHVMLWEFAIAMAGRVLGINPFDQPDVEAAKKAARALLESAAPAEPDATPAAEALASVKTGDYLAICAFVDPTSVVTSRLVDLRVELGRRLGVATTLGIGPRFLHSTGQLHKGGPHDAVFVQVVGDDPADLAIPDQPFTFGQFKHAQAAGDLQALRDAGQSRAYRVALDDLLAQ
jgi:glucose-6-phosphate isomerase